MGGKRFLAIVLALCVVCVFSSCAKKGMKDQPGTEASEGQIGTSEPVGTEVPAWDPETITIDEGDKLRPLEGIEPVEIPELQTVYFDYNKFDLRPDAMATLRNNLEWLRANPDKKVLIEGHCDERGTEEYNLSLGDKRANEVLGYLKSADISGQRVYTISYGESRPVDPGHNEGAWAKNRRAVFKVYYE